VAVKIKICGIKDYEDARLCVDEGVDALGFIFYTKSPRFILAKEAKKIIGKLPCFINKVGVFVDEPLAKVRQTASFLGLDTLQFHGSESASYCRSYRDSFKVIKSFFPKREKDLSLFSRYKVDGVLLDIPFKDKKKMPKATLDFRLIKKISSQVDYLILSGGLSCSNVGSLIGRLKPYAVDVARGVERFPGKKDRALVREFIKEVRRTHA